MDSKVTNINNTTAALAQIVANFGSIAAGLGDNEQENLSIIKSLYVVIEAIKQETVVLQQELDNYSE